MPAETPPPKSSSPAGSVHSFTTEKMRPKTPSPVSPRQETVKTPTSHQMHQSQQQHLYSSTSPTSAISGTPLTATTTFSSSSGSQQPLQQNQSAAAQQFCLRWNNYQTNLTSVFDQLLQNESFVDVTLACDGQSIKAHKMVLSACSPYFQALFFDNPCQHPIIIMRDVKWPEMKAVVEFMYKGEINVSQDQIGPLLRVAEMLKIRGLADVNSESEVSGIATPTTSSSIATQKQSSSPPIVSEIAAKKARVSRAEWELSNIDIARNRKRRWPSNENTSGHIDSPTPSSSGLSGGGGGNGGSATLMLGNRTPDVHQQHNEISSPVASVVNPSHLPHPPSTPNPIPSFPIPSPLECMGLGPPSVGMSHVDDMEIKPGIAEMIREEERAKLMENSHAWLGASTSSIADSYQYQLQSMWQKCWNTNQNLMHHLRFRERGPLKSWRPETMAEAIFSVLKEGLSLSQAARKYDIPYPTFVLYANRVHNMLGPSIDGGTDLRPKGRGRPQRILLGIWPDEHIKGVIKTVVFRDAKELKDEGLHLAYGRHSPVFTFQDAGLNYHGGSCTNGLSQQPPGGDSMSPEATAAAVAAVAHGIRQQMQMAAAAQHHPDANLFNMPAAAAAHHLHSSNGGVTLPKQSSPVSTGSTTSSQRRTSPSQSVLPNPAALAMAAGIPGLHIIPGLGSTSSSHSSLVNQSSMSMAGGSASSGTHTSSINMLASSSHLAGVERGTGGSSSFSHGIPRLESPSDSAHDLRMNSPDENSLNSPIEMTLEPAVNLAVGVSGMAYKPSRGYSPSRPENLFQEDITDLVGGHPTANRNCPPNMNMSFKEPPAGIKIEPITDCRSE